MATLVAKVTRDVDVAASTRGRNGSWAVSLLDTPSYPIDSAQAASPGTPLNSLELNR